MEEFWILLAQIIVIVIVQSLFEMFIDKDKKPYISPILTIACYAVSLALLLRFIFDNVLEEILPLFSQAFQ